MDVNMEYFYSFFVILIANRCFVLGNTSFTETNTTHNNGQGTVSGQTDHFNTFTDHGPNAQTMSTEPNFAENTQFPVETYKQMNSNELSSWLSGIQSTFTNKAKIVPKTSPFTQKPTTHAGIDHDATMGVVTESYNVNDTTSVKRTPSILSKVLSTHLVMNSGDRTTTEGYSEHLSKSTDRWSSIPSVPSTELREGSHGNTVIPTTVSPTITPPPTITTLGGISEYPTESWSVTPSFPTKGSMKDSQETTTITVPPTTAKTVSSTTSSFTTKLPSSSSASSTVYDRVVYTDSMLLNYETTDLKRLSTTEATTITSSTTSTVSEATTAAVKVPEKTTATAKVPETKTTPAKVTETPTRKVAETTAPKVPEATTTSSDMAVTQESDTSDTSVKMSDSHANTTDKPVSKISKSKQFESLHRKRFMEVLKIVNGTDRFNMSLLEALDPDLIPPEVLARFINSLKPQNVTQLDEDDLKIEIFDIVQKVISMDKLVVAGCTLSVATFLFVVLLCIIRCRKIKPEPQNESMKSDILQLSKKSKSSLSRNGSVTSDTFMGIPTNNAIWRDIQSLPESASAATPESKSSENSKF